MKFIVFEKRTRLAVFACDDERLAIITAFNSNKQASRTGNPERFGVEWRAHAVRLGVDCSQFKKDA